MPSRESRTHVLKFLARTLIFNKMRVKVNTQRSCVKCNAQRLPLIKYLLTDEIISENWLTLGLPTGNYYASLGCKYAYFYATQCVTENP